MSLVAAGELQEHLGTGPHSDEYVAHHDIDQASDAISEAYRVALTARDAAAMTALFAAHSLTMGNGKLVEYNGASSRTRDRRTRELRIQRRRNPG